MMGPVKVIDPQGRRWRVSRRWFLWRPRAMELMRNPKMPDQTGDESQRSQRTDAYGGHADFSPTGLPLAILERLLLLVLLPPTVLARALNLLPWTVVARQGQNPRWESSVRGAAAAARVVAEVVDTIEQGRRLSDGPDGRA